ncbi:MAG: aminodeoxychorismate/anthranilate synthase component II [Bacteroidia bacterium]|nr:aminodeoxychorismate/anthranilate synthase component II [Bacteroidia bacterium]
MILLIDNYDSFTWNLADLVRRVRPVHVVRHDAITLEDVITLDPAGIIISPGPGRPEQSGVSLPVVSRLYHQYPILGVCLGHQLIAQVMGARVVPAQVPMHGKTSLVYHQGRSIFAGLPDPVECMRYHSLVVDPDSLPDGLEVTAKTEAEEIMGIHHKIYNLAGVQFHPESVRTTYGFQMMDNWLQSLVR